MTRRNAITSVRMTREPDAATQRSFGVFVLGEARQRGMDVSNLVPAHTPTDSAREGVQQDPAKRPA